MNPGERELDFEKQAMGMMTDEEVELSSQREAHLKEVRPELRVKEELDNLHLKPNELISIDRKPTAGAVGEEWTQITAIYRGHDNASLQIEYPSTNIDKEKTPRLLDQVPLWFINSVNRA
ncbi:MAG: hypothetical protein HY975_02860 [Candidatus Kerfeldbacteria bacterium]|nr:hypothetical protein [Candidatus Kerfeldbacteria bacterium]